jgi:predicted tellurium resistance membrane protein TerC
MDFSQLDFSSAAWISLLTLTALEVVLGIDNVIFISILSGRVNENIQARTRRLGLFIGMIVRVILLLFISWILKLEASLFTIFNEDISGKDLILIIGGLFLLYQSTNEIHAKLEGEEHLEAGSKTNSYNGIIVQMFLLNIVFSLDSVITAIGMAQQLWVMITAVLFSVLVMLFAADPISNFVHKHPTIKILALSFLFLIGVSLIAEGFHQHLPKGYIYFAMAFSFMVELINLRLRKPGKPVTLKDHYDEVK